MELVQVGGKGLAMDVLIVCSGNAPSFDFQKHQAFIYDQVEAVKKVDGTIRFDYFFINQKGVKGYLGCLKALKAKINIKKYDCIHAHFSTSALLANLQRNVPVITTFHGSDINLKLHRGLSFIVALLSKKVIYVSDQLLQKALFTLRFKSQVLPCGINFEVFVPQSKAIVRQKMGLELAKKYILFSSHFENKVKNAPLAMTAVAMLQKDELELIELKNYSRAEVADLMAGVDVALMTSFSEGSPQFVKEALACNCPVVSTDVGDVQTVMGSIEGCFIASYEPEDVANKLRQVLSTTKPFQGRDMVQHFDNQIIAKKLILIYKSI